jgi:hypothetical protein
LSTVKHSVIAAMTVFTASIVAAVFAAGGVAADLAVPQPGGECRALDNAQTFSPTGDVLICPPGSNVQVVTRLWQRVDGIQRPVQAWFTYGPEATLAADDVTASARTWVGWNGFAGTTCTAEQTSTSGGPPVVMPINYDQLQEFHLLPDLATLKLKGSCDWRPAGSSPYGP